MEQGTLVHVVSAVLALIILIDVSVPWLTGKQVPELLGQLVLAVFASYFASSLTRGRSAQRRGRSSGEVSAVGIVSGPSGEKHERGAHGAPGARDGKED